MTELEPHGSPRSETVGKLPRSVALSVLERDGEPLKALLAKRSVRGFACLHRDRRLLVRNWRDRCSIKPSSTSAAPSPAGAISPAVREYY